MDDKLNELCCRERFIMVTWPFKYIKNPTYAARDCCLCRHESASEKSLIIPPLIEIGGTWISPLNPIPVWFIILRLIITLYIIYVVAFSFAYFVSLGTTKYWIFYFTMWTNLGCMILMIIKCISTYKVYKLYKKDGDDILYKTLIRNIDKTSSIWKQYLLHSICLQMFLPSITMVVFNFFAFVNDGSFKNVIDALDTYQLHGGSCIAIWIDFLLSADRMYYKSFFWPMLYGNICTVWAIIFELFIYYNEMGESYSYEAYDWSQSITKPIIYYVAAAITFIVSCSLATFIKNIIFIYSNVAKIQITHNNINQSIQSDENEMLMI